MQKVKLPADLTSYEQVFQLDPDSGVYFAAIVITNSGFGDSEEVLLSPPEIPSINGERIRLSSYSVGNMKDYPGDDATPEQLAAWYASWQDNPVPDEIKLDSIASGESIYIIYKMNVIGKADNGVPTTIPPHTIDLPEPSEKEVYLGPVVVINGKKVGSCRPEDADGSEAANPARIADLLDKVADGLSVLMYSTVADYGIRLEDAYTNAKLMQSAKVIVGVQKYLTYISTVVQSVLGTFGGNTTPRASLVEEEEENTLTKMFSGTLLLGAIFDMTDNIVGHIQPFMNSIKTGKAKESQVIATLKQLEGLGSLRAGKRVYAELATQLSELEVKLKEYGDTARSGVTIYDNMINLTAAGADKLPTLEKSIEACMSDFGSVCQSLVGLYANLFVEIQRLSLVAISYQVTDADNYYNYNTVISKLKAANDIIYKIGMAYNELQYTASLVKSHVMLNHHLRGAYEQDVDKIMKDYKLDQPWEVLKAAYDNEDIKSNYLKPVFENQVDAIDKLKDIYGAKESFRSLKDKVKNFSTALGGAWDKDSSAILAVLGNEGLELMKEFEPLKKYAEFIDNTMKLIQLANEKDEMTKAMGAFGDATLRLNYHTYEAVRKDKSTGKLSKTSPLIIELMGLISEAIILSNEKSPGAFKPLTGSDREAIRAYLVEYLNIQRAKYPRSDDADSNWMKAHVSAVMAALFEQVYVTAITDQATPEDFMKFMQNADKVENTGKKKTLDGYLDTMIEKKVFRDVRLGAMAKIEEAQAIVRQYSTTLMKNSSYPVKEIIRYLEDLVQKLNTSSDIEKTVTRRYKDIEVWQINSVSNTRLEIRTNYVLSFREYQKALLNTDLINAENMMAYVDYMTAAVYDLIVRSALMVVNMSPNAISGALGAAVTAAYDSVADQVFNKLDDEWKTRSALTAKTLAELALTMGSMVMKEADVANSIYDLIAALDNAIIFDPPLDTELVTYSIKDVVIPEGETTGTGQVLVTFRNDGDRSVAISPSVSIYTSAGKMSAAEFNNNGLTVAPGETVEFIGTFTVDRSMLIDCTGYSAVLSYMASEPSTVSIAAEQGPFVIHFFAGTERQISAMRNKVSAGTVLSGWVTGSDTLTGSVTVKAGQNLRIFATAPANGELQITVTSPSGETVAAESFINDGDYVIIRNCEEGTYTIAITTPEGFDNRITVEGVVSSFMKDSAATVSPDGDVTVI